MNGINGIASPKLPAPAFVPSAITDFSWAKRFHSAQGEGLFLQRSRLLGEVGCDAVHQGRRKAIVGFQTQVLQPGSDGLHFAGLCPRFDDGGDESCEFRSRPAAFPRQLGMDEVQSIERMFGVFDAAVHMDTAVLAGIPLNGCAGVDDFQLVRVAVTLILSRGTTATTENTAPAGFQHFVQPQAWLWAVCAPTADGDGVAAAPALERPAREVLRSGLYSIVH